MNYIINNGLTFLLKYKVYFWIGGIILVLLIFVGVYQSCKSEPSFDEEKMRLEKEAIEKHEREKLDNRLKEIEAPVIEANRRANEAAANTANVVNRNYTNTNLTDAEKARCAAYPQSRGCEK